MTIALIALGVIAVLVLLFIFLPVVAWILVGIVLLILALVLLIPIGADIAYVGGEFTLAARADGLAIQLIPRKPRDSNKPPRKKKEKQPKEKPEEPEEKKEKPKKKLDFTFDEIMDLLKKVLNGLGKFGRLTVRRFMLHYTAAGEDPYNTAMIYGYVNTALCTLAPICAKKFRVTGEVDVATNVDFAADKMQIDAALSVTLRLIQVVHAALAAAFGALGVLIRHKLRLWKEKRAAGKQAPEEEKAQESIKSSAAEALPAANGTPLAANGAEADLGPVLVENYYENKQAEERND